MKDYWLFFGNSFNLRRIILLEFSQYLENFLWPNINPDQVKFDFKNAYIPFEKHQSLRTGIRGT
jgi:hypothetical protein